MLDTVISNPVSLTRIFNLPIEDPRRTPLTQTSTHEYSGSERGIQLLGWDLILI